LSSFGDKISPEEFHEKLLKKGIKIDDYGCGLFRAVFHYWITKERTEKAIEGVKNVLS